jgi:hypothetical protein
LFYNSYLFGIVIILYYTILQITKGGFMAKRLFFILPVLFVFSLLFVQVSESADGDPLPDGTYHYTITKIGFYRTSDQIDPDADTIINLPSSQIVRAQVGGTTPSISDFVYLGNIPNGSFFGIGVYVESSDEPNFQATWFGIGFDNRDTPIAHTFTDSSRNSITIDIANEYVTVGAL